MTTHHAFSGIAMKSGFPKNARKVKNTYKYIRNCDKQSVLRTFVKEICHFPTGSSLLTVLAADRDQKGTPNSTFHYEIKSVSPKLPDVEFFIDESGKISFKGCLDQEARE